jgi:hypothetical protein
MPQVQEDDPVGRWAALLSLGWFFHIRRRQGHGYEVDIYAYEYLRAPERLVECLGHGMIYERNLDEVQLFETREAWEQAWEQHYRRRPGQAFDGGPIDHAEWAQAQAVITHCVRDVLEGFETSAIVHGLMTTALDVLQSHEGLTHEQAVAECKGVLERLPFPP